MTLFLLFSIVGLVWLTITVFKNSDNIRSTLTKLHSIPTMQRFTPADSGGGNKNNNATSTERYPPIEMDSMNNVNYKESVTSSRNDGGGGRPYRYQSVPSMNQPSDTGYGCRFDPDAGAGEEEGDLHHHPPHKHSTECAVHQEPSAISQGVPSQTQYPSYTSVGTEHSVQRSEERIPKCYKLKELESDLESITRLELDDPNDPQTDNDYVYGPWRVYCESRDGKLVNGNHR
ncbi:hypothetical protein RvY_00822 [Ramazzottius varieornatus]|uniref:Uncharacterized protein n=1 Tax=Ramazzottius varieornatus TaxID=947166 RepID=A0A1D1UE36_RAMVA|nr:hypothetical protein RvY_00822 [Ramazzottius varieornatus]